MPSYQPYVIQSLVNGQWHTRSRLNELNHALIGNKITEQELIDHANVIMQNWSIHYGENATLRVARPTLKSIKN